MIDLPTIFSPLKNSPPSKEFGPRSWSGHESRWILWLGEDQLRFRGPFLQHSKELNTNDKGLAWCEWCKLVAFEEIKSFDLSFLVFIFSKSLNAVAGRNRRKLCGREPRQVAERSRKKFRGSFSSVGRKLKGDQSMFDAEAIRSSAYQRWSFDT